MQALAVNLIEFELARKREQRSDTTRGGLLKKMIERPMPQFGRAAARNELTWHLAHLAPCARGGDARGPARLGLLACSRAAPPRVSADPLLECFV